MNEKKTILWISAVALVLRLLYLLEHTSSPYFSWPILDELYLDNLARHIAAGDAVSAEPYFRAPLYSLLLGVIYSISLAARFYLTFLLQHIAGALTCLLSYLIAREAFGRRSAIAAGILAALYGPLIFYEGELLIVTLFILLNSITLYTLIIAAKRDRLGWFLLAGAALGLAIITRPNILLFAPIAVIWALAVKGITPGWKRRLLRGAAVAVPILLVLVMTMTRNYAVSGQRVLVSSQGGINFYKGNGPTADGMVPATRKAFGDPGEYRDRVEVVSKVMLEDVAEREFSEAEVDETWYGITKKYVRENPGAWLKLMGRKFVLFWNDWEIKNNKSYYFCKRYSTLLTFLPLSYGIIAALGLMGLVLALVRTRSSASVLVALYVVVFMGSIILFFVCARLRLPVMAGLIPCAGGAIGCLIDYAVERRKKIFGICMVMLALLLVFTMVDWYGIRSDNYSQELWTVGLLQFNMGDYEESIASLSKSIELEPGFPDAYVTLGNSYLIAENYDMARENYDMARSMQPENARALNGLGICAERVGDLAGAMKLYRRTVEVAPGFSKGRCNLGMLLVKTGELEEGREHFEIATQIDPVDPEAQLGMALHAHLSGQEEESASHMTRAVELGGSVYNAYFKEGLEAAQQ